MNASSKYPAVGLSAEPGCTGAASQGLMLSLMNCQLDVRREVSYLNTVFDDVPDGITCSDVTRRGLGAVSVDNDGGARRAARHFRSVGRRRALVTGPPLNNRRSSLPARSSISPRSQAVSTGRWFFQWSSCPGNHLRAGKALLCQDIMSNLSKALDPTQSF